ncbi:hypothetical protein C3943_22185 [Lysinibacillus sp. B2A1]|nr:hypothetical protein C3943_22185 [Lysinibacillus sp. B2A1]
MKYSAIIRERKIEYKDGDYFYFLLENDEIVYIGKTTKVFPPVSNHNDKIFTHVSILSIDSFGFDGTMEELFYNLIFDLLPKYNTVLPPNDRYMTKNIMKKKFDINGIELNRLIKKNKARPVFMEYYDISDVFKQE